MKATKLQKKLLISLIVFCLFISLLPAQSIVYGMENNEKEETIKTGEENQKVKPQKVREITEKRTKSTQTWRNSDLTETIEVYPSPIFYQEDGKKEWKRIDNNLTEDINDEQEKGKFKYKNKANKYKSFFGSHGDKEIFKMKQGKYWLSYAIMDGSNLSQAKAKKDTVRYKEIFKDTDVKFYLRAEGVKEDFIFHTEPSFDSINYELKTNLEVRQNDRKIEFYDNKTNEVIWSFTPPYLIDADDKESHKIDYKIVKNNGKIVLELPLDKEFLQSKETKYPVILDPTLTVGGATSNTFDSYVGEYYSDVNYGGSSELRTGYAPGVYSHRSYIKFGTSLPSLNGGILTSANIKAYKYYEPTSVDTNIYIHRAYSSWSSSTIKWNNQPQYGGSYASKTFVKGAANGWYSWSVGNLVDYWYANPSNYYGIVMAAGNENTTGSYRKFYSSDYSSGAYSPRLEINYSPKPSVPTSTPYSNKDGTGYVNLSWPSVAGATGYKVLIFNGRAYEEFDAGNVTSWSTKGKKLWPTKAQIDAGQYNLRKNGDGRELPENPNDLYKRGGGNYPTSTHYWFQIKAYNGYGVSDQSNAATPSIPDQTKPTVPGGVAITNDRIGSFTLGWQPSTDIDGSGISKYKVFIGDQPGVANIANGIETTSLYYTYSGALTPRKTYYAWVQAIDKAGNISNNSVVTSKIARKDYDAQIESYSIPDTSDVNNKNGEQLWFDVRNTGTNSWTNDLNISLSVTSTPPDGGTVTPFAGYLNTGEVIKPNEVKRFYVTWKRPQEEDALKGSYGITAVVGKGTGTPIVINPPENKIVRSIVVKDLVSPTGIIKINEDALFTKVQQISLNVSKVFDNAEGYKYVQFANGPENATTDTLQFSVDYDVPLSTATFPWVLEEQEGKKFVYARFKDESGNYSSLYHDSIIFDQKVPEIEITNLENQEYISGTKIFMGTIKDLELTEYKVEYRNKSTNSTTWETITQSSDSVTNSTIAEWDTSNLPTGEYEISFSATDNAGNTNTLLKSVWVDNVKNQWFGAEEYFPTYPISLLNGSGFVNLYNGSLNIQEIDFSVKSRSFSLSLGRSYASNRIQKGLLGTGWYSSIEEHLEIQTDYVNYIDTDGTVHRFDRLENGQFSIPTGTSYSLSFSETTGYKLIEKDGSLVSKIFNDSGKLAKIEDSNGNQIDYKYTDGVLTTISSLNKSISLDYNTDNTLKTATFSTGEKVSYNYLDGVLNDVKLYTKSGIVSNHIQYFYQNGKMESVVAENGLKVSFVFNGNRLVGTKSYSSTRVIDKDNNYPIKTYENVEDTLVYNLNANTIYVSTNSVEPNKTSKSLANTLYELNDQGNLWKNKIIRTYHENEDPEIANEDSDNILLVTEYDQNRIKSEADANGNKTTYEYDSYGNILKTILPEVTVNGVKSTYILEYKYNGQGQLTHAINTKGQVKEWKYDEKGNLYQIIDEEGNNQYLDYDSFGNIKKIKSDRGPLYSYIPDYSMENSTLSDWYVQGTVSKVNTQAKSGKQSVEINTNGVLQTPKIKIKKGRLPVLTLLEGLAPIGSPTAEIKLQFLKDDTVIDESIQSYALTDKWDKYRVNGNVPDDATHVRVQVKNTGTEKIYVDDLVLEESNLESVYVYDSTGENVTEVIDAYGNKTSYTYNEYGLPLTETNALNQTQSVEYNEELQVKKHLDREGRITEYQYNSIGNVEKEINSLGQETNYQYNEWGQLVYTMLPKVTQTYYQNEIVEKVEEQQAHLYIEYDELGRKINENDENGNIHSQQYDSYGRIDKIIDPMQNQKYNSYDKNGNIIFTADFAYKTDPTTFDGFLVANGETHATFDEWNRQVTETDNTGNRNVLTMTNTYDSESRLIHTKDAEGTELFYSFNALGENIYTKDNSNPVVETWTYYDGLGNDAITISDNTIEYSVTDANGNVIESIDHKGTKTSYEYNSVGDKVKQINPDGSTVEWTFNKEGQIKTETQKVEDTADTSTYLVTHYDYNNAGEVKYQKLEAKVISKDTNVTNTFVIKETDLTYDELGRIVREFTKNYSQGTTEYKKSDIRFLYDLNGNLVRKWIYDESTASNMNDPHIRSESIYEYDANNRFTLETKVEDGTTITKQYKDDENTETINSAIGPTIIRYNENDLAERIETPLHEVFNIEYLQSESIDKITGPRLTIDMDYGTNEKMTSITTKKKDSETVIFSENYTYNAEEQIKTATNATEGQKDYTYTKDGFLQSVKKGIKTNTYTYDVNGNLLKAVDETGKILVENQYGQGNRITSSIQYDATSQKYKKVTYSFRPDGSLLKETYSLPANTYDAAKQAAVDVEKEYNFVSINLLQSIITKKGGTVVEKVEFTYDSEDNRSTKKVTNSEGERTDYYYYDSNGDLVSIGQQVADATIENLFNFYRDANGQLLNFEYKGQIFDYVYNQRGDIVAITDELQEVIARYTYDEWGNLEKIDAPTEVGAEIAQANPYRYVGKFGVQYDQDTNLYFMGWRDYDSKIGRFIVADEYEGDDNNPISFNRYLYAEADPVNNIDPDGYLPKWLKKLSKGVKKTAKAAYNFAIGDDINTLKSKKTKWYQKAGAAVSIASNFIPGGGIVTKAAKAIFKGTRKAVKTYKASRAVSKATRVVRSKSKRVAAKVNKRPKTVHASSIRSTPKGQSSAASKVTHSTPKPKPKATVAPKPARAAKPTRVEKLYLSKGTPKLTEPTAGDNIGVSLRLKGTVNDVPLGGAYKDVPSNGGEVHHMPANSVSPLSRGNGPGVRMETIDHRQTASWGNSREARAYRVQQKSLIEQGKFNEAQNMDIIDLRNKFGNKYDEGIRQMLEYTQRLK